MKERKRSRGWYRFALVALLALGVAAPAGLLLNMALPAPASANQELHPGGRLFFPAWDVRGARLSFLIITRLAMFPADQSADGVVDSSYSPENNCRPGHSVYNPSTGPPSATDDVHLEFYGKSCEKDNEVLKMSCADVDLIFLSAGNLDKHYNDTKNDQQGALDVHFIINGSNFKDRVIENSLMGSGVIADPTEGWALAYPAAAAKATSCDFCADADGGTPVGYEPFPVEVFIPWALADDSQGGIENLLYLWAPTFFPGYGMPLEFGINWLWWDGRERRFTNSSGRHAFVDNLKNMDPLFKNSTFTCGHTTSATVAENDGDPSIGGCTAEGTHTSDAGQTVATGFTSTAIGWWDILKVDETPTPFPFFPWSAINQVRGMVGVVAATVPGDADGNGDAIRLWHKDPCEVAPQGSIGPPHLRDWAFRSTINNPLVNSDDLVGFNLYTVTNQRLICRGDAPELSIGD